MAALPKGFLEMVPLEEERKKKLIAALDDQPIYSIRLNPFKKVEIPFENAVPWATDASYLKERPSFIEDPLFHAGAYYSQEASSMAIEQFLKNKINKGQVVLDLCAAPGGKSTHILSLIPNDALLVSNEVIKSRSWILKENIDKWGVSNVLVSNNDPEDFSQLEGLFDVIVVDAPCSGEGMFRKDVNAREEWSAHNVNLCAGRQQRIIADIWPALKAGGILIFSTCTFNRRENEATLAWLHEQYELEGIELDLANLPGVIQTEESGLYGYRFFPGLVQGEGFFMAGVVKQEGKSDYKYPKSFRK